MNLMQKIGLGRGSPEPKVATVASLLKSWGKKLDSMEEEEEDYNNIGSSELTPTGFSNLSSPMTNAQVEAITKGGFTFGSGTAPSVGSISPYTGGGYIGPSTISFIASSPSVSYKFFVAHDRFFRVNEATGEAWECINNAVYGQSWKKIGEETTT